MNARNSENAAELIPLGDTDALAPYQFSATFKRSQYLDPEKRLLAALLEDAVSSLTFNKPRYSRRQQKDFTEAHAWVNEKADSEWIFSFVNVCEALGMDANYLRKGLNEWARLRHKEILVQGRKRSKSDSGLRHKQISLRTI